MTIKGLMTSLELENVCVSSSTMAKRCCILEGCQRAPKSTLQCYWENALQTDGRNVELLGENTQNKKGIAHQLQNIIPMVKYGGEGIMILAHSGVKTSVDQ